MQIWQRHITTYRRHKTIKTPYKTPVKLYRAIGERIGYDNFHMIARKITRGKHEFASHETVKFMLENGHIEQFDDGVILWLD